MSLTSNQGPSVTPYHRYLNELFLRHLKWGPRYNTVVYDETGAIYAPYWTGHHQWLQLDPDLLSLPPQDTSLLQGERTWTSTSTLEQDLKSLRVFYKRVETLESFMRSDFPHSSKRWWCVPQDVYLDRNLRNADGNIDLTRWQHFGFKRLIVQPVTDDQLGATIGELQLNDVRLARGILPAPTGGCPELRIQILWPGYQYEFNALIKTWGGKNEITSEQLLRALAKIVANWYDKMKDRECHDELWDIKSIPLEEIRIVGLYHRGGLIWQPELWIPRARVSRQVILTLPVHGS